MTTPTNGHIKMSRLDFSDGHVSVTQITPKRWLVRVWKERDDGTITCVDTRLCGSEAAALARAKNLAAFWNGSYEATTDSAPQRGLE